MQKDNIVVPKEVSKVIWFIEPSKLDPQTNKMTIVSSVLMYGSEEAWEWLFAYYGKREVAKIAQQIPRGQWDPKSLALWSMYLKINPRTRLENIIRKAKKQNG